MGVAYKKLEDQLVLTHSMHGKVEDLPQVFAKMSSVAGTAANGPPVVVLHFPLTDKDGRTMDVCIPLSENVENTEFETMTLTGGIAATTIHRGSYSTIMDTYRELISKVYKHGHPIQENGREEFQNLDLEHPEKTVVEIQSMLIDWEGKLKSHLGRVLGSETRDHVLSGFDELTLETEQLKRASIIKDALCKLDEVATEEQKYEALSCCGHEFPAELIEDMKILYRKTNSIDTIIQAMKDGHYFYPHLRREGNILYDRKAPARQESFDKAQTRVDKLRAICFCPLLNDVWDEMPGTFCYCAAGWSRRLFEGILDIKLKVDVVKSLTKGDDYCEFAIHLPENIT
ncbi:AraC family transcriptional regulator [Candidatus Thorarchaeota archaeon]|nr:MAG: AraC family transcriptional regulator [Candidatus Thorarchaeota archaeon]